MTQLDLDVTLGGLTPVALPSAESLAHPYARYGLAVALAFHANRKPLAALTEVELREALAHALESGLNSFRMETLGKPERDEELQFGAIPLDKLRADPGLVSGSLAVKGKYLYPSIVASDKQVKGTFADVEKVLADLRDQEMPLNRMMDLKRSIAPIAGEINNGSKEKSNQRGTLFEAACTAIATVASEKPAAQLGGSNTGFFPDLHIEPLVEFVRVFRKFQAEGNDRMKGKPAKGGKYKRPPMHDGNYPDAPRDDAFGAVGLLAAMGYWASRANETTKKETLAVLDSLESKPFYLVSYDGVSQAAFRHHVIELAKAGNLQTILSDFYREARPYSVYEEPYLRTDLPLVRHFYFATSRFLQRFDAPAFRDFLATRAEYPPSFNLLLEAYFMQDEKSSRYEKIPRSTVESARALGQWINRSAYFVAEDDTDKSGQNRTQAVRKAKAKVLVEFESAIMSAASPEDMLHRVSTRAGRLLQADAPAEATAFFDAAVSREISFKTAQHLLIAYLRLRTAKTPELVTADVPVNDDSDLEEKETEQ